SQSRTGDFAAGFATPAGGGWSLPARWAAGGTTFLPLLAGDETGAAYGVNDAGLVVGESVNVVQQGQLTFFTPRGAVWLNPHQLVTLASLATAGDTDIEPSAGLAVNDHGLILGQGKRPDVMGVRGFVLDLASGQLTDLGSLQGTPTSSAEPADLNEQGQVVGSSEAANFFDHAFLWQDGVMTDLHALSGVIGRNSHAAAINEAGQIVGDADPTADFLDWQNAALWENGVVTYLPDLGDLGGVIESFARDINDHGTIVGTSITPTFEAHAVIWRGGQVTDLNTLIPPGTGWLLANAFAIGNDGRIVGEGFTPSGIKAFLLVPDSDGGFEVYGAGCAGGGGFVPGLWGQGWPQGGGELSLALTNGQGGAAGLLLVGLDDQSAPFKGCTLSVLPLAPISLPLLLTPGGAGGGQWGLDLTLPPAVPLGSIHLQAALADPAVASGVVLSNALRMDLVP
ncbi:MAG TPA: DUF3466 family protein, partial [Planctomycetota bacterium]|nr:DUF3466 family protein [Planctomycetota bacterium]